MACSPTEEGLRIVWSVQLPAGSSVRKSSTPAAGAYGFVRCILSKVFSLNAAGYTMKNYSIYGPNSNSFAGRLVESCGGKISGNGPLTGWDDGGNVGF